MTNVLILNWTKLKQFTDINESVDASLLRNAVREAQDIQLQRVIGTLLYESILNKIETNTLTGPYKVIVDSYIQDMLLYSAYYNALESIFLRPRNNGLLIPQGGENSAAVDKNIYEMKRTSVQNKFEYYSDRLSKYIVETQADFPELSANTELYQQLPDYGSQYRAPIVMSRNTRARYLNVAQRAGVPVVDSAFPQYPPPRVNKNRY